MQSSTCLLQGDLNSAHHKSAIKSERQQIMHRWHCHSTANAKIFMPHCAGATKNDNMHRRVRSTRWCESVCVSCIFMTHLYRTFSINSKYSHFIKWQRQQLKQLRQAMPNCRQRCAGRRKLAKKQAHDSSKFLPHEMTALQCCKVVAAIHADNWTVMLVFPLPLHCLALQCKTCGECQVTIGKYYGKKINT